MKYIYLNFSHIQQYEQNDQTMLICEVIKSRISLYLTFGSIFLGLLMKQFKIGF